jgi:hypothetical protein
MKPVRWTSHALREIAKREIDRAEAELTLHQPDAVIPAPSKRRFYQRRYIDKTLNETMLLRVLIEETDSEMAVVTLSSRFTKRPSSGNMKKATAHEN